MVSKQPPAAARAYLLELTRALCRRCGHSPPGWGCRNIQNRRPSNRPYRTTQRPANGQIAARQLRYAGLGLVEEQPYRVSGMARLRAVLPAATLCSRAGCALRSGVLCPPVAGEAGCVLAA